MKDGGIQVHYMKNYKVTTNTGYLQAITHIWTWENYLQLVVVIGLLSRKAECWAMGRVSMSAWFVMP